MPTKICCPWRKRRCDTKQEASTIVLAFSEGSCHSGLAKDWLGANEYEFGGSIYKSAGSIQEEITITIHISKVVSR